MTSAKTQTQAPQRRPKEETARLGREIYKQTILPQVEADHFGEYVAIDVETGDWAMADSLHAEINAFEVRLGEKIDARFQALNNKIDRLFYVLIASQGVIITGLAAALITYLLRG